MAIPGITAGLSAGIKPKPTTILKKPPVVKASAPVVNFFNQTSKPTNQQFSSQASNAQLTSNVPSPVFKTNANTPNFSVMGGQTANVQDAFNKTLATSNTFTRPDGSSYQVGANGIIEVSPANRSVAQPTQGTQSIQQSTVSGSGQVVDVPQQLTTSQLDSGTTFKGIESSAPQQSTADSLIASTGVTTSEIEAQSQQRIQADPFQVSAIGQEQTDLRGDLDSAFAQLGTKGQRLEELRQKQGMPSLMDDLAQINKQIASRSAQYSQALLDNQSRPGLITNIQGKASLLKRQQAVEIGAMTAMAEAMQGNFDIANQYISDTIKVEFEDAENEVNRVLEQLQINKENMSSAEKKEAAALEQQLFEKQQAIQNAKEERQNVFDIALRAAQNGADSSTLQAITNSGSMEDALGNAGQFLDQREPTAGNVVGYDSNGNPIQYLGFDFSDLSSDEKKSMGFYNRMEESSDILSSAEMTAVASSPWGYMVGNTQIPNAMKPDIVQQIEQAQLNFINAKLRQESGAAIGDDEYVKGARQYFPKAGDKPDALAQKQAGRDMVIEEMRFDAQRAIALDEQQRGISQQQFEAIDFTDTPEIEERVKNFISQQTQSDQMLFNALAKDGIPYSFLEEAGQTGGIISQIYEETKDDLREFRDTVMAQYEILSGTGGDQWDFNRVGGDTEIASVTRQMEQRIPAGTKYTNPTDGECGHWTRKIVEYPHGTGNTLAEKQNSLKTMGGVSPARWQSEGAKLGDVLITNESAEWGHVAVVTGINRDGTVTLSESNFRGTYTVSHDRRIPMTSPKIQGVFRGELKNNIA